MSSTGSGAKPPRKKKGDIGGSCNAVMDLFTASRMLQTSQDGRHTSPRGLLSPASTAESEAKDSPGEISQILQKLSEVKNYLAAADDEFLRKVTAHISLCTIDRCEGL
ncbi:Hypothetical predicted protein [Pelobates cultripes]|uniref:Uncharacterized protein n=1 Tax=Pelobates cultripes TaxID=61616 RepID=A0AAD1SK62_PELCU|nr:Hypothetical predicted protein [Pelobates cultripes]